MRRQRRAAALRDKQDRVKMGLLPPPPPKGASEFLLLCGCADVLFARSQALEHDARSYSRCDRRPDQDRSAGPPRDGRSGEAASQGERGAQAHAGSATREDRSEEGQGRGSGNRRHVL